MPKNSRQSRWQKRLAGGRLADEDEDAGRGGRWQLAVDMCEYRFLLSFLCIGCSQFNAQCFAAQQCNVRYEVTDGNSRLMSAGNGNSNLPPVRRASLWYLESKVRKG